jgi:hypothetical protein
VFADKSALSLYTRIFLYETVLIFFIELSDTCHLITAMEKTSVGSQRCLDERLLLPCWTFSFFLPFCDLCFLFFLNKKKTKWVCNNYGLI